MNDALEAIGSVLRVQFCAAAPRDARLLAQAHELEQVAIAELPGESGAQDGQSDVLDVRHLPGGSAAPMADREAAQAWLVGAAPDGSYVDLVLQSDRILWCPGRALVIGAAAEFEAYLRGLASFSLYETELRRLETRVAHWCKVASADITLTHQVDGAAVRRWPHVNDMTVAVTGARFRHLAIEGPLEKGPAELAGWARRLFLELALASDVHDRLARLDDKIDALADLYELANDRISEYSYFRRELVLEVLIVAVLALEAVLLLYDLL